MRYGDPIIIAFGSGKGGVGKSTVVSNIGAMLALRDTPVGFLDADLGGANLHLCLGIRCPKHTVQDFLSGRCKNLQDIMEQTVVPGTWLICGASDVPEIANPLFIQKQKIIANLKKIDAAFILVDLGAGTGTQVTDFFTAFNYGVVVTESMPSSIENAYGFLKNSVVRGISRLFTGRNDCADHFKKFSDPKRDNGYATVNEMLHGMCRELPGEARIIREWLAQRKTFLILNMVKLQQEIETGKKFAAVVKKYLDISLVYLGHIPDEPDVRRSLRNMKPLVTENPPERFLECFTTISENLRTFTHGKSGAA
jgi:flagellar biosynthesis protein FlhG